MENAENKIPTPEVKDEDLDSVSGGAFHPGWSSDSKDCPNGCGRKVPYNWVGPCPICRQSSVYVTR